MNTQITAWYRLHREAQPLGQPDMQQPLAQWLEALYRQMQRPYPKFHKMDNLCKAGYLAAEHVFLQLGEDPAQIKEDTAIAFFNRSASLDNDLHYQQTLQPDNYFPSPALFVYTLANIVTGEVAIRNKIMGETSFYVMPSWDAAAAIRCIQGIFLDNHVERVLCGWVEVLKERCDVLVFMADRTRPGKLELTEENIHKIYYIS